MLFVSYYFWIAPHALLALLALGLVRRSLHRRFPFFFCYVVFELVQFLILFSMHLVSRFSQVHYRWGLVSGLVLGLLLKLGVLDETGGELLYRQSLIRPMLTSWLRAAGASLLLAASLASVLLFRSDASHLEKIFRTLDFSFSMIVSGLLLLLLWFARYLHVALRCPSGGILLGFGIYATVGLASSAIRAEFSEFAKSADVAIGLAEMAAYHVAVLVWLGYLLARESSPQAKEKRLPQLDMEFWNQELEKMVGR